MPSVLVPLPAGFEELETVAPVDVLRRAGAEVVVAALGPDRTVTGRNGLVLVADALLTDRLADAFDCILLPGGPGVKHLRADLGLRAALQRQTAAGRWLAAICAAPTVLLDAGLLANRRYTAHASVAAELPARLGTERVVVDGRLVTSRGAGTALEFGLALVTHLFGPEKSAEIAHSIGW